MVETPHRMPALQLPDCPHCMDDPTFFNQLNFYIMTKNMGSTDRIIRLIVAAVAAVLYFTDTLTGTLGIVALVVAAIFTLTSVISFCPLYAIAGVSTCKR